MIILSKLEATPAPDTAWPDSSRSISSVHHEISPGWFINVGVGPAGLQMFRGRDIVAIPLDDLVRLAIKHHPDLAPPPPAGEKRGKGEKEIRPSARPPIFPALIPHADTQ